LKKSCELKQQCPFYLKYKARQSNVWQGIFNIFCRGATPYLCERRRYYYETGRHPSENLMPTGKLVPNAFLLLP